MKRRTWILLIALLTCVCGGLIWWRIEDSWKEMATVVQRIQGEFDATVEERPVLWGKATAGTAYEHYKIALEDGQVAAAAELDDDAERGAGDWALRPETGGETCRDAIARLGPAFAAIRRGAQAPIDRRPIDWAAGFTGAVPNIVAQKTLVQFMTIHAWALAGAGEPIEATRVMLDSLQFSRDSLEEPVAIKSLVGAGLLEVTAGLFFRGVDGEDAEYPAALAIESLSPAALGMLAAGLARLDRPLPPLGRTQRCEAALFGSEVRSRAGGGGDLLEGVALPGSWRFAFSIRWMAADAVIKMDRVAAGFPPPSAPWSTWRSHFATFDPSALADQNFVHAFVLMNAEGVSAAQRRAQVTIRVLRMLVGEALGTPAEYDDPFGGKLRRGKVDGRTAYWSVGADAVDDGGIAADDKDVVFVR